MDLRLGKKRIKSIYKGNTYIPGLIVNGRLWHGSPGKVAINASGFHGDDKVYYGLNVRSATINVSSGGVLNSSHIPESSHIDVLSGGTVKNTSLGNGDNINMTVQSGGFVSNVKVDVHGFGRFSFLGGCTAKNVDFTGTQLSIDEYYKTQCEYHVTSNTNLSIVSSGKTVTVVDGVLKNGSLFYVLRCRVHEGGVLSDTTVNAESASIHIYNGGNMRGGSVVVGYVDVYDGGTANSVTLSCTAIPELLGSSMSDGCIRVYDGGTVNNPHLNGGTLIVSSGGTANNIFIDSSYGRLGVSSGGVVNGLSVPAYDTSSPNLLEYFIQVMSGGSVLSCNQRTPCDGSLLVQPGGYVTYNSSYSGVYYGSNGKLTTHRTSISDITVSTGVGNAVHVCDSGLVERIDVQYGGCIVSSGGTANSITIQSGGTLTVCSDGVVDNVAMIHGSDKYSSNYGSVCVLSGGTATNVIAVDFATTKQELPYLYLEIAPNTYFSLATQDDFVCVVGDGICSAPVFHDSTHIDVLSGGMLQNAQYDAGEHVLNVSNGGVVSDCHFYAGSVTVCSGGFIDSIEITSMGVVYISSGGTVDSPTIKSGGRMYISSGGTALNVTSQTDAVINVESGGYITYT